MEKILYAAMCAVLFFVVVPAMNPKQIANLLYAARQSNCIG